MRQLLPLLLGTIIIFSCTRREKESANQTEAWLNEKKAEYSSCVCLTAILQGNFQGQAVYEVRGIDPLCLGINSIYKTDGTPLFNSGDQQGYQSYLDNVSDLKKIWTCSRGGQ